MARARGDPSAAKQLNGLDLFGLTLPMVAQLIQELPGASECRVFDAEQSCAPPSALAEARQGPARGAAAQRGQAGEMVQVG